MKFDRDGHSSRRSGSPATTWEHFAGRRASPSIRDGRLYAVDASFNNVRCSGSRDGRLLAFFGEGGDKPGSFLLPAKVSIDYDNIAYFQRWVDAGFEAEYLILVTSQFGDHLVSVFAYGKERGKSYPSEEELLKQIEERRKKELRQP